jgi:prepilin-type N-terminal cleavage/methylation domain-containing protein
MKKGFTLLELIVVIIIVGILATLGYTQYTTIVEKGRLAEATVNIGLMRKLATEYYLKNGSITGIQNSDVWADGTCSSTSYYSYYVGGDPNPLYCNLWAERCTSGGKTPNTSRGYKFFLCYSPSLGLGNWRCQYTDNGSSCFGLPP